MFRDRKDAGMRLAKALSTHEIRDPMVLGIAKGGAEVGYYVAQGLHCPLVLLVVRKLPLPENPEAGFGAIAEDGSTYLIPSLAALLSRARVDRIQREQQQEIQRRVSVLRGGEPLPSLRGRAVLVVDDGIAMGSTMIAAITLCRNQGASWIVAAAPVAGPEAAEETSRHTDQVVVLESPQDFRAVALAYENWYDVPDEEVISLVERSRALSHP